MTAPAPARVSVNVELVRVAASIAREKVAVGATEIAMPLAPLAGVFAVTVGGPLSVVKLQLTGEASSTPSAERMVVSSRAVYVVFAASADAGVSVATRVAAS